MIYDEGDKSKQPADCKPDRYSNNPCKNLKEVGGGFDGERYECKVCGQSFYLDYDEMR